MTLGLHHKRAAARGIASIMANPVAAPRWPTAAHASTDHPALRATLDLGPALGAWARDKPTYPALALNRLALNLKLRHDRQRGLRLGFFGIGAATGNPLWGLVSSRPGTLT
jgi:hypothetical protein